MDTKKKMDWRHQSQSLLFEAVESVLTVTINRLHASNTLNTQVLDEFDDYLGSMRATWEPPDPWDVRAMILTGSGDCAFVAGTDLTAMATMTADEAKAFSMLGHTVCFRLQKFPVPVIAALNGDAFGCGLELALSCDILLASSNAKFGLPEVSVGIMPGLGAMKRLPRRIGPGRAARMIFSGETIDADEAVRIGLVDAIYPPEQLLPAAHSLAQKIASQAPKAVAMAKRALWTAQEEWLLQKFDKEVEQFSSLFSTHDQKEGMAAFLAKRSPQFLGR